MVYLPGQPWVDFSSVSAVAPPKLRMVSRRARPMVALARWPEPRTAVPLWMPIRSAIGPLTITTSAAPPVVVVMAPALNWGCSTASAAASTTGK